MYYVNYDAVTGQLAPHLVAARHIKPHFGMFLGCGCQYYPDGVWVDGRPTDMIRSGQEPAHMCRKHMSDYYNGIDVRFP